MAAPGGRPRSPIPRREMLNLRIPLDMVEEIKDMAIHEDRSVTQQVVRLLRAGLQVTHAANAAHERMVDQKADTMAQKARV